MDISSIITRTKSIAALSKAMTTLCVFSITVIIWASPANASPAHRFNAGEVRSYKLDYLNRSSSDMQHVFDSLRGRMGDRIESYTTQGLKRSVQVRVKGTLQTTTVETTSERVIIQYRMTGLSVSLLIDGHQARQEETLIKQALGNGIIVHISPEGAVTGLVLPREIRPTPSGIIRAIISHTQVVLPTSGGVPVTPWETVEEDLSGRYRTAYTPGSSRDDSVMIEIIKSRLKYLPQRSLTVASQQSIPADYQPSGDFKITLDEATGNIRLIQGSEKVVIRIDTRDVGLSETSFQLQLFKQDKLNAKRLALLRKNNRMSSKTTTMTLSKDLTRDENNRMLYRQKLGDDTLETLLSRLANPPSSNADETELFLKFRSLIYLMPKSCKRIGEIAGQAKPESHTARILISALTSIGSPPAQDALIAIARSNKNTPDYFIELISLLGLTEEPTEASEQLLQETAYSGQNKDTATTALLALGNMAHRLSHSAPKRAERIINQLIATHGASNDEDVITTTLAVLGNAALDGQLTRIIDYSRDTRPAVRKEAAAALRFYTQPAATKTILSLLSVDQSANVRRAAVEAMGFQEIDSNTVTDISAAYRKEADEDMRKEILKLLWKSRQKFPVITTLIEEAKEHDPSEKVRTLAKELLNKD